jgi:hypothetical protein
VKEIRNFTASSPMLSLMKDPSAGLLEDGKTHEGRAQPFARTPLEVVNPFASASSR